MKISSDTLNILKNFSTINHSIVVKQGNSLRTISPMKNILATAEIEENFEKDFAIYDLNEFLSGLTLFKDAVYDFSSDSYLVIKSGNSRVKYFYSDPSVITAAPEKDIPLPSEDVVFTLTNDMNGSLLRASSVYQLPDLSLVSVDGNTQLVVRTKSNDTSNNYCIDVNPLRQTSDNFSFNFKVENIKILPGDYEVTVSSKNIALFKHTSSNLKYWIALEPDSIFVG